MGAHPSEASETAMHPADSLSSANVERIRRFVWDRQ
jgi:hypothetical protein